MKRNIVSILIGIVIGLPISVAAAEARPEQHDLLPRPAAESYIVELPTEKMVELADAETIEEIAEQDFQADLQLLACLVHAEAGNQDMTGKRLVVDTVLNRVADPRFPNTISGVIYEKNQFSPVTNGALADAYYTVTDEDFQAVAMELSDQIDYSILYFTAEGYGYGTPVYKYGDHYFSK
jgi:N-acetylmuramoyl-L-alanine amidase